ncbi:ribonuclease HI family protein [Candidatus Saganbacteria bacterium]|nr:ribonuclease HI family protein [Candidatus Saganbacteria bacterium]
MKVEVFADGASRGNPGEAGLGVVVRSEGKVIKEVAEYIGRATNNVAEYLALIRGLEEALLLGANEASFFSDSELMVKQIKGEYKVKNEGLQPLHLHARQLIAKFKKFEITHKYREDNQHADDLANRAIHNARPR